MIEWVNTVSIIGFPAFMCVWFMYRMEKVINRNSDVLKDVSVIIEHCKVRK